MVLVPGSHRVAYRALAVGSAGRCCVLATCGMLEAPPALRSDRQGESGQRDRQPPSRRLVDRQLLVTTTNPLDERVPGGDHPDATTVLPEASQRTKPRLATTVVSLDAVGGGPVGAVPRRWEQLSSTCGNVGARSVTTSTGASLVVPIARSTGGRRQRLLGRTPTPRSPSRTGRSPGRPSASCRRPSHTSRPPAIGPRQGGGMGWRRRPGAA